MGLGTPLCRRLGIEHPIFCAGMGSGAGPELVAAVSNAGGFGVLGAAGSPPEEIQRRIGRVRELTDRPFGVNFIIGEDISKEDREFITREVATAAAEGAAAVVLFGVTRRRTSRQRIVGASRYSSKWARSRRPARQQ